MRDPEREARGEKLRLIGQVGVVHVEPEPDLGYMIHPDFWGQGFATEAVRGCLEYWWSLPRREDGKGRELIAKVVVENVESRRVLEKLGFRRGYV